MTEWTSSVLQTCLLFVNYLTLMSVLKKMFATLLFWCWIYLIYSQCCDISLAFFFPFSSSLLKCYLRIMSGKVGWLIMVPHSCNLYVRGGCESLRDPSQQILAVTSYILSTLKISCASQVLLQNLLSSLQVLIVRVNPNSMPHLFDRLPLCFAS